LDRTCEFGKIVLKIVLNPVTVSKKQIYLNKIKHDNDDVDNIIRLFKGLVGMILLLCAVVGCIVVWEVRKGHHIALCICEVIGDGVCDDRQNVAECSYDGKDCCLLNKNESFCEDCKCHLGKCSK
jgi:hypothetical protein